MCLKQLPIYPLQLRVPLNSLLLVIIFFLNIGLNLMKCGVHSRSIVI